MILRHLVHEESDERYQRLEIENLERQYGFLRSIITAALATGHHMLSAEVVKSLNYHAISCLHAYAGQYRPCPVVVEGGADGARFDPPNHHDVPALMSHFVDIVNRRWDSDPVSLASLCLWRLNYIHPFINGNGRTARALCYYVLCVRMGGPLPGVPILPELIRQNRPEYVTALRAADRGDFDPLNGFVSGLLEQQLAEVPDEPQQ